MTTERRNYGASRSDARRESREAARKRLDQKQVTRAYRAPRGNPDVDREAMNYALAGLDRVVA